jgi:hypothetical protein
VRHLSLPGQNIDLEYRVFFFACEVGAEPGFVPLSVQGRNSVYDPKHIFAVAAHNLLATGEIICTIMDFGQLKNLAVDQSNVLTHFFNCFLPGCIQRHIKNLVSRTCAKDVDLGVYLPQSTL